MNTDQYDLNPYVLRSNVLFYHVMQKLLANLIKLLMAVFSSSTPATFIE